jgi:SAM-dependent methyltransferase
MTVQLRLATGQTRTLAIDDWHAPATDVERGLCASLPGPVLDIGCGPGRMVVALAAQGVAALGVDASPAAVATATRRGAAALCHSVYDRLPVEGRWRTVLLFDGNIGIGGDPLMLLGRIRELLAPDGAAVIEVEQPGKSTTSTVAQLVRDGEPTAWFPWATVSADRIATLAVRAGLRVVRIEHKEGRWFSSVSRGAS